MKGRVEDVLPVALDSPARGGGPRDGFCWDFSKTASAISLARARFPSGPPISNILCSYPARFVTLTLQPVRSLMNSLSDARIEPYPVPGISWTSYQPGISDAKKIDLFNKNGGLKNFLGTRGPTTLEEIMARGGMTMCGCSHAKTPNTILEEKRYNFRKKIQNQDP